MSDKSNASTTRSGNAPRYRNFATVVYPESAPNEWKNIVSRLSIPGFISPLHDKDVNPTGEPKKAHYHILFMFDGVKSKDQVSKIFGSFGGVGCEIVNSARGYARYLCHLDNPEKAQYDTDKVVSLAGSDYLSTIGTSADKFKSIQEMQQFCDDYDVTSFYLLSKYAAAHRPDWSRVLIETSTVYMTQWLKSRQWSKEQSLSHIVDTETGEILI